jgi:S1-C subfamily serine protease/beta-lactamase regulating signal transducer with metallopeptidase domain/protocatechuate 3,4-dioxygenase beta subunit
MDTLTLARSFTSLLLDTAAKGTALLLLAAVAAWLCRRSSAALRHSIWCMTMGGLLVLPVASWALPAWQIPILPPVPLPAPVAEFVRLPTPVAEPVSMPTLPPRIESGPPFQPELPATPPAQITIKPTVSAPSVIEPVPAPAPIIVEPTAEPLTFIEWTSLLVSASWLLGVSLFGVLLLVGLWRTVKLRRTSLVVSDGEWPRMLVELRQRLGLARSVELREHAESIVPLTWGIWRPVVLLPKQARAWDEPMRRAVLLHELAHVQRGDVACQVLGRMTCVLYWFHPLAWFALRQLRQEREQACDDAVVQSGERASDYAEQLLQVARLCCAPRGLSLGVAMAEGSSIERRILSLFDSARSHGPLTRRVALASLIVGGVILAGLAPIEPTASHAEPDAKAPDLKGLSAKEQMELLKPKFGDAKRGIQLGVAFASPAATTYALGDRVPMVLFFRNAGQQEVTFQVHVDFMAYPPSVVNEDGQKQSISSLLTFIDKPTRTITLKPDEVYSVETYGLGLGKKQGAPSFESPVDGKYTIEFSEGIFWNLNDPQEKWSEGLTSGTLEFEVTSGLLGQQAVLIPHAASNLGAADTKAPFPTARQATVSIETEREPDATSTLLSPEKTMIRGMGSGIIVSADGLIVTANHVVDRAQKIQVKLHDGTELPASVVGTDPAADLAVLLIHTTQPLTVMPEQHQVKTQVGDKVTAIGSAWGHTETLSRGVVTGLGRDVELNETQKYTNLIQTDAANEPGYSGGPLLNAQGEAIGINVAVRAGVQKIGFAVPIQDARKAFVMLMSQSISGRGAREQMDLLKPVFGEAKRGIQLGLAIGSLERTFLEGGRIPLWLFYRNVGNQQLTFNLSQDYMNHPVTVTDEHGKRVQVKFIMHWRFVPPLTITLKPGEVWCIATTGLNLGEQMPSIKPVAGQYKLTYPQGIWDVNTTQRLNTDIPLLPSGTPDISGLLKANPKQPAANTPVGQVVESPNWSESLDTGVIEFEIAPGKNGQLEARILAMADAPEQIESAESEKVQEERIYKALESPTTLEFDNAPLREVFEKIADQHGVAIVLDAEGLKEVGFDSNSPIDISVKGIQLSSALKLILEPLKLSYVVENGVLNITSQERQKETAPLILRGRVLDAKQRPVEEALLVFPCFMKESTGTVLRIFRTHSGRDGEFMIKVPRETVALASFSNHSLIWCRKDGHGLGAAQIFTALSSEPLTVKLPALDPVEFVVQSDQGAPLPGVRVEVEMTQVPAWDGEIDNQQGSIGRVPEELKPFVTRVSDADGKVILDTIPRDRHYDLKMTSKQYGVQHFQDPRKYLKLLPVAPVTGKLSNGQAGVKLTLSIPHRHFGSHIKASTEVVTDAAGHFSIPKFPVGPVKITSPDLQGPMFLEATDREVVAGANNTFDLQVIPGIRVRGRVMLEKPRRGIRKAVVGFSSENGGKPVETDEDGNYTAFARPQLTISTYFVGSSGEPFQLVGNGLGLAGASAQVPEGATEVTLPDIVLAEGLTLSGQLLDENQKPVSGVYVAPFPASLPLQVKTGPTGNFGAIIRAEKRPSGWVVGWEFPPDLSFGQSENTTWAKVVSQEPLILQVSRKSQPERIIPYSEIDMDAPVPMDQVVWGEIVDGWQPGFWLKSTGEPTNQQVPLNALVTYRLLLRNTSDEGRDVVFRKGPDVPYVIPSSQLAQALSAGELPQEYQSEVSKFVYKGIEDHVIFVAAGESLLLYGSDTSSQAGLFVGAGDSQRYSRLATVAQPGKNWIVQPLMVQTLTPEERTQLEESLKSDRSRSSWDMTMLDRNGQPRKETAKTATPQAKGIVGIPLTRFQTLHAKIEREVGTLVAAVPDAPIPPKKAPEEIQASLDSFPWNEAIGGLQTCILSGDSPDAPGIVEMNEMLAYGVTVRNPTDKRLDFLTRIELPYLVPEEQMQGELSPQFRAEPLSSAPRLQESIYRLSLEPGEAVFLPGINAARFPDTAVSMGDAMGTMPDEEGDFPRIATVHVGTNWLVQPLTIQMLTTAEAEAIKSLPEEVEIMKVDAKGKPSEAKVSLVDATLTGKAVVAKQRIEVATRSLLTEQHADDVTWGRIDKGLQCGIRLLNPKPSYKIGDTLEAETLWRNSSDEVISTTRPRQLDLYPIIQDAQGNAKQIDFGARFRIIPGTHDFQPSEVVSLGISKITLVAEGTPSPKSNMEPGQITLEPGKYQLIGNGGAGNINPRSGKVEFTVVGDTLAQLEPKPAAPGTAENPSTLITGRVLNQGQQPLAGATVALSEFASRDGVEQEETLATGQTDESGAFQIEVASSLLSNKTSHSTLVLWGWSRDVRQEGFGYVLFQPDGNHQLDVTIFAPRDAAVRVVNGDGTPVQGTVTEVKCDAMLPDALRQKVLSQSEFLERFTLHGFPWNTDDSTAQFSDVRCGVYFDVPGRGQHNFTWKPEPAKSGPATLTVPKPVTYRGQLTTPDRQPLPKDLDQVRISLKINFQDKSLNQGWYFHDAGTVLCDSAGRFEIAGIEPLKATGVHLEANLGEIKGWTWRKVQIPQFKPSTDGIIDVELPLVRTRTVRGQLSSTQGAPLAGIELIVTHGNVSEEARSDGGTTSSAERNERIQTDSEGRFSVEVIPGVIKISKSISPGSNISTALPWPESLPSVRGIEKMQIDEGESPLDLPALPITVLSGQVVDDQMKPYQGMIVAKGENPNHSHGIGFSAADGSFRIEATGEPTEFQVISMENANQIPFGKQNTDTVIKSRDPLVLQVVPKTEAAAGAAPRKKEPAAVPAPPKEERAGTPNMITGQIVNDKQEPLSGAEVVLVLEEDDNDSTKPCRVVAQATTDGEGRYALALPAEVASSKKFGTIWARAKGHTLARGHWSSVIPALSNRKDQLTLTATSGTKVQVLDQSGKPLEGVRVRASRIGITDSVGYVPPTGWDDRISAITDSHGDATLTAVIPDSIQGLSLQPPGESAELQFGRNYFLNVRPEEQGRHFSFRLPATGSVDGQLKIAVAARLPEGLTLTVRSCSLELPQFDGVVRVPVAADGTFRIEQIPVGQLIVPPFLPEDQPLRAVVPPHVEVQTGKMAKLEIAVAPGVQVQGRVIRSDLKTGFAKYPVTVIYGQSITNRRVDSDWQKFELKTNEEGVFTCILPPGPMEVQAATHRDGYQKASSWLPKERLGMWGGTRFTVPQRESFELEPIELTKSAPIQGQLIDQNKAPIEDWTVFGFPEVPGFEPSATMNSMAGVETNSQGQFLGTYPVSYPPVRWKVSHRIWKTNFEFDDIEYRAEVIQKEPLILQVDTTKPIQDEDE